MYEKTELGREIPTEELRDQLIKDFLTQLFDIPSDQQNDVLNTIIKKLKNQRHSEVDVLKSKLDQAQIVADSF